MPQTENEMQASSDEDCFKGKIIISMGVAVAQLVERLLLIPEVHGLNPVIGKIYIEHLIAVNCIEKTKINIKEAGVGALKNTHYSV